MSEAQQFVWDTPESAYGIADTVREPDPGANLERYRRIMAEVRDFVIFTLDADGQITDWNAGAEIIFGHTAAEVIGRSADIIFTPEDRAEGVPEQERATAATTGRAEDER